MCRGVWEPEQSGLAAAHRWEEVNFGILRNRLVQCIGHDLPVDSDGETRPEVLTETGEPLIETRYESTNRGGFDLNLLDSPGEPSQG